MAERPQQNVSQAQLRRYVETARVQVLLPIARDAVQAAAVAASLYDDDLTDRLDALCAALTKEIL